MSIQYVSAIDAAAYLEVSSATIRNWTRAGLLCAIKNDSDNLSYDLNEVSSLRSRIENGQVKRLDKRANKTKSKSSYGLVLDKKHEISLRQIFEDLEASNEEQRVLLIIAAQLYRFAKRENQDFSSFLLSKKKIPTIFKELIRDELIPLDVLTLFEELSDDTLLKICKGDYLGLLSSGQLSKTGAFYTPDYVVEGMIQDHVIFGNTRVLDPCCGSGAFLIRSIHRLKELGVKNWNHQIWGIEIDPASALCAKLNILFEMDETNAAIPNVITGDALDDDTWSAVTDVDLIVSNPPWGAKFSQKQKKTIKDKFPEIKSTESFSCFMVQSLMMLREGGVVSFLCPEAILNVKSHRGLREYLLKKTILDVQRLGRPFDDVFTDVARLSVRKSPSIGKNLVKILGNSGAFSLKQEQLPCGREKMIRPEKGPKHIAIMSRILDGKTKNLYLKDNAEWALGIVTGNNKELIADYEAEGYETVVTGKDIAKFSISSLESYVRFIPESFQQCAKKELYKCKEKLIYKFISRKLCFVRDEQGLVTLNSANIVIPRLKLPMSVVCAILNSAIAQYFYEINFGSLKVLRGCLEELPIANFKGQDLVLATELAEKLESNPTDADLQQNFDQLLFDFYKLDQNQITLVKEISDKQY